MTRRAVTDRRKYSQVLSIPTRDIRAEWGWRTCWDRYIDRGSCIGRPTRLCSQSNDRFERVYHKVGESVCDEHGTRSTFFPLCPSGSHTPLSRQPNVDVAQAMSVGGRVAAASLAFSGGAGSGPSSSHSQSQSSSASLLPSLIQHAKPADPPAPSLPRRTTPNAPASATSFEHTSVPGVEVDKLVSKKVGSLLATFQSDRHMGGLDERVFGVQETGDDGCGDDTPCVCRA